MDLNDCYKILEIESAATEIQVKEAFRDLMQIYHPDRLNSLSPRIKEKGARKATQLNEAREMILNYLASRPNATGDTPKNKSTGNERPQREKAESNTFKYRLPCDPTKLSPIDLISYDLFIINRWEVYTNRPEKVFWSLQLYLENDFQITGAGTIADRASGLLWEESGSKKKMTWADAHNYVRSLNRNYFSGFKDWRLPAFIELSSLYGSYNYIHEDDLRGFYMEPYFLPEFDKTQLVCWSCDTATPGEYSCQTIGFQDRPNGHIVVKVPHGAVWVYNYSDEKLSSPSGEIAAVPGNAKFWVRAVRSMHTE